MCFIKIHKIFLKVAFDFTLFSGIGTITHCYIHSQ